MAEPKGAPKGPPKSGGGGIISDAEAAERITVILAVLIFAGLLLGLLNYFLNLLDASGLLDLWRSIVDFFKWFWPIWKFIAAILVALCVAWAIYAYMKLQEVIGEEEKIFGKVPDDSFMEGDAVPKEKVNEKWLRIEEHANSNNEADWRLAIIEADILLEDTLRAAGYHGDGVGEILKTIEKSDMLTLDAAWDGHKVRNRIAHSGGDFNLDEREAKRVVKLFESVFREFGVI